MEAQKLKKQQIAENTSNKSLTKQPSQAEGLKKKTGKKDSYVDILQKNACSVLTEVVESALKQFILGNSNYILPRDLVMQMGYTQLCASIKQADVRWYIPAVHE